MEDAINDCKKNWFQYYCAKKCPHLELFLPVCSCIRTERGEIVHISPYSIRIGKNIEQHNSKCEHFSHSVFCAYQSVFRNGIALHKKLKFSIKDFFSKCDQIRSFLRISLHSLKKFLMENFHFLCSFYFFIQTVVLQVVSNSRFLFKDLIVFEMQGQYFILYPT